ncbi:MAG TPA: hypothetical protein VFR17_04205 [Mycobacterium sp.]|nr:hypothetical protein [Mycobacterium sp.]
MNMRLLVGSAVGAGLGAALLTGPVARADEYTFPSLPVTVDEFQTWPPASEGYSTSQNVITNIPGYYHSTLTMHYQDYGAANQIIGQFDTKDDFQQYGGGVPFGATTESSVVTDSSGTGLPVGTTWDASDSDFNVGVGFPPFAGTPLYESYSISIPDGMTAQFSEFLGMGSESVTGSDGAADYLYFFGSFIPVSDTFPS